MEQVVQRRAWSRETGDDPAALAGLEWLVTNGLGGYASGTLAGAITRRFHGLLIAALRGPFGRVSMLTQLEEQVRTGPGALQALNDPFSTGDSATCLAEFRLEIGLPVWRYEVGGAVLEKRLLMLHEQNTVHVSYRLVKGAGPVVLRLRPLLHFRPHEAPFDVDSPAGYTLLTAGDRFAISNGSDLPELRLVMAAERFTLTLERPEPREFLAAVEARRGYDSRGSLWTPGYFEVTLSPAEECTLVASTEPWETLLAVAPDAARATEHARRQRLLALAGEAAADPFAAELVLAADQFITTPVGRTADSALARAGGDEVRTVIAGYHWFTDWGRDTMISLEGLTLATGRQREARYILQAFAQHVRDGLIPNLFSEGEQAGLYHTADASLWFFHAIDRYLRATGDRATLAELLPILRGIVDCHLAGTRFGIAVDPVDGLLRQGAEGYQLTWMDAKVDDWVVTPRRGKAVEINALWYNALCLLAGWLAEGGDSAADEVRRHAERARASFNERFWYDTGGYLYDVVDGETGDDPACRPNQVFAISLPHPVLDPVRWQPVLEVVRERLLTPVGLRSLAPGHPNYCERYDGDLRARDAAYHQGTVWAWLAGPYVDAWLKVHPDDRTGARAALAGFRSHLNEGCVGSISEIFDAEPPFTPRGCIAQAWSVAEVLRTWIKTAG